MICFDIEIAKLPQYNPDDYEFLRDKYSSFDFRPEFNKVICISYVDSTKWYELMTLSWDEKEIIEKFLKMQTWHQLVGHNIIGFDIPFIIKRWVILGIIIPDDLKLYGAKPWTMKEITDTYKEWKHLWQTSSSLNDICIALDLPTPKENMNGSQVDEYFRAGRIAEIASYCEADVKATVQVYKRFKSTNLI